jgi:hypothetical protein
MSEYARSSEVYRELRAALGPWCKANGYRRRRGFEPGWVRGLNKDQDLSFWFRANRWGGGTIGGGTFSGMFQVAPSEASGAMPDAPNMRQADFGWCLLLEELDELRQIQNAINARRPRTPELEEWLREDSPVGEHTRERYRQYAKGEEPYRVGDFATLGYYSVEDVRAHAAFLARRLPELVVRFAEQRCARPNPQPQPPFGRLVRGN